MSQLVWRTLQTIVTVISANDNARTLVAENGPVLRSLNTVLRVDVHRVHDEATLLAMQLCKYFALRVLTCFSEDDTVKGIDRFESVLYVTHTRGHPHMRTHTYVNPYSYTHMHTWTHTHTHADTRLHTDMYTHRLPWPQ